MRARGERLSGCARPGVPRSVRDGSRTIVSTRLFHAPQRAALALPAEERLARSAGRRSGSAAAPCLGRRAGGADHRASTGVARFGEVDVEAGLGVPVDDDRRARLVLAEQEVLGEDVLDHVLDDPAQRSRAVGHVVAELDDVLLGGLGDLELHLLGSQLVAHPREHQVHDLADLLDRQRAEDDRRVDPVEELRPEVLLQLARRPSPSSARSELSAGGFGLALRPGSPRLELRLELLGADVRGHDDDAVAEVDPAALGVGQVAVLEDLQQDVEDLRVRLLDLVEQDDGSRSCGGRPRSAGRPRRSRRSREARRPAGDTLCRSMNSDMSILIRASSLPNMNSASALRQLGLADAGRAEEDERADRPLRVLEAGARAPDGLRDDADRLVLADDRACGAPPPSAAAARTPPGRSASPGCRSTSRRPGRCPPRRPSAGRRSSAGLPLRLGGRRLTLRAVASASRSVGRLLVLLGVDRGVLLLARCARGPSAPRAGRAALTSGAGARATTASSIRSIALSGRKRSGM